MKYEKEIIFGIVLVFFAIFMTYTSNNALYSVTGYATQPPRFQEFYGTAKCLDGNNINDGKVIITQVTNGTGVIETQTDVSSGGYHVLINGFPFIEASSQDNVSFYLDGEVLASDIEFEFLALTELNLVSTNNTNCYVAPSNPPGGDPPAEDDAECEDGIDNDGDGCIDYPMDPGCVSSSDDDEGDVACTAGNYCSNECDVGEKECINNESYHYCRNFDPDPCLEWSSSISCDEGFICQAAECIRQESDDVVVGGEVRTSLFESVISWVDDQNDRLVWMVPTFFIVIILLFAGVFSIRTSGVRRKKKTLPVLETKHKGTVSYKNPVEQKHLGTLDPFIQRALRQGHTVLEIRSGLLKKNWPSNIVDSTLRKYK